MAPRIVVTGGRGFVGAHLTRGLLERGFDVVVTTRGNAPFDAPPSGAHHVVVEDAHDGRRWAAVLRGADAVVHLAARVHVMRERAADPDAAFRRANVDGTRAVLQAAAAAGVGRVVVASSVKAVGESNDAPWDARTTPCPADPYGRSKREAELVAAEIADVTGLFAPCLRLPLVYGPGVGGNFRRLLDAVAAGRPVPLGGVRNRRSLAFVGNVVAAVIGLLGCAPLAGQAPTPFVSDEDDVATPELVRAIGRALGRPARLWPAPVGALRAAARVGDRVADVWSGVPWTTAAADRLFGSLTVDVTNLRQLTGYRPVATLDDGLRSTAAWHRGLPTARHRRLGAPAT